MLLIHAILSTALIAMSCMASSVNLSPSSAAPVKSFVVSTPTGTIPLTLVWDRPATNTNPSLYNIYIGGFSKTYTSMVSVAYPSTSLTLTNLNGDSKYFFNITSVFGTNESLPAGEIMAWSYTTNDPALQPPTGFNYKATNYMMFQQSDDLVNWYTFVSWFEMTNGQKYFRAVYKSQ